MNIRCNTEGIAANVVIIYTTYLSIETIRVICV